MLFKSQLGFRLHPLNIQTITFEHSSILDPNNGVHYITIYRLYPSPENGFTTSRFLEEFDNFLQEITLIPGKLVIKGDFNVHL